MRRLRNSHVIAAIVAVLCSHARADFVVTDADFVDGVYEFRYYSKSNQAFVNGAPIAFSSLFLTNDGFTGPIFVPNVWFWQAGSGSAPISGSATLGWDLSAVSMPIDTVEILSDSAIFQFNPWTAHAFEDRIFGDVATPSGSFGSAPYTTFFEFVGDNDSSKGAIGNSGRIIDVTALLAPTWLSNPGLLELRFGYAEHPIDGAHPAIPKSHLQIFRDDSGTGDESFLLRITANGNTDSCCPLYFGDTNVPVTLQQSTATFSQTAAGGYSVHTSIDGQTGNDLGWALSDDIVAHTAVFETVEDIGIETGTLFKFELIQTHSNPQHTLGRFRLSVTTDDRADFADGLDIGGDVSASWTVLKPESLTSANGTTLEVLSDNSILASGTSPDTDTYTVIARTSLNGITGFRLEALEDASLPVSGPGRNGANGNFVLTEFDVSMAALNSLAEETAPPAYSAVDDFDSEINGEANTWSYRLNAGLTRDGNYTPLTTYSANPTRWNPSIPLWTNNTNIPWIGVNTTGGTATWIGNASTFLWPDHTITMHPSFSTLVVVSWQSPEDGIFDVYFSFADMDNNSGDGVDWWVDLGDSAGELASGTFPKGGQSGPRSVLNVSVNAGERINFIVGPGAADEPSFDSTRFEAVILKRPTPVIYGLKSFGTQVFVSSDPVLLFSIDQSGTVLDEIGTVALDATDIDADGLAVSPTFGLRAFQITAAGSALISINGTDASATLLGDVLTGRDLRGAAFDPSDNLWAADATNDEIMRIHASTGEVLSTPVAFTSNSAPFDLHDISGFLDVFSGTLRRGC